MKLISLFLLLISQTFAHEMRTTLNLVDGPEFFGDSAIYGPEYKEQVKLMQQLAENNKGVNYIHYGDSIKGRPLSGLLFLKNARTVTQLVVITGATHGNEYLNIVDRLPQALMSSKNQSLKNFLQRGGAVFFVPILNPDGYDARRRSNMNGVDLNRDWPNPANGRRPHREIENIKLAEWVDKFIEKTQASLSIAVDYHCCVSGALLLPWGYKRGEYMNDADATRSEHFQTLFKNSFPKHGKVGTPPDILYSATGTTLDYWYDKYAAVSFTYEGNYKIEKELLKYHVDWWEKSLDSL